MSRFTPSFNPNVVPVGYDVIVQWIQQDSPVWIPKLGRQSINGFWCSITNQGLIRVSANKNGTGSSHVYNRTEWMQICNIIQWAIDNGRNPEFTYWYTNDPHHQEAPRVPSRIWGPNVPAICRSYNEWNVINNHL